MQSKVHNSWGYGEKYQGFIRCLPSSISWTFFIRVTTSSWCVTILPDCLGVFSVGGTSWESSSIGTDGVGVAGGTGVGGAVADIDGAFRFLLNFFWRAAARTVFPLTWTSWWTGLAGRDVDISLFGVDTPVVFCPVVRPSFLGNCTFLVSRSSSRTHSSNLLLTENIRNYFYACDLCYAS